MRANQGRIACQALFPPIVRPVPPAGAAMARPRRVDHAGRNIYVWTAGLALATLPFDLTPARAADFDFKSPNTYAAQENDHYCGPATAQMILNATSVNVMPLPTQDALFTTMRANLDPRLAPVNGVDQTGMRAALAAADPAHTYVAYQMSSFDAATRTLAYNISHYNVPGAVQINGNGHWIDVYGVKTSVQPVAPAATADFKVNAFYIRDPWTGYFNGLTAAQKVGLNPGLGTNAELDNTADGKGLWNRSFLLDGAPARDPANPPPYRGRYSFVTDPDADLQTDPSQPILTTSTTLTAATALGAAAVDISSDNGEGGDATLQTLTEFENGSFTSTDELAVTDPLGGTDFLVPYDQSVGGSYTGAVLLDGSTGGLLGAFWDNNELDLAALETGLSTANGLVVNDNYVLAPVPEPGSFTILGSCLLGLVAIRLYAPRRRAGLPVH